MSKAKNINDNEQIAAEAFSRQSAVFDKIYAPNEIIQYKRERVRNLINKYLPAASNILELNAGTGEDVIYFAQHGHTVHATDISAGMLSQLTQKVDAYMVSDKVTIEQCSFTNLYNLENKGPYNLIFSNFAGLNCTDRLDDVLCSFDSLLEKNGLVVLVMLPPFCMWETFLALSGNFNAAFRRWGSKNGAKAHIEGVNFKCWYYKPQNIINALKGSFDVLSVEGLCSVVPPSYFEHFPAKRPALFRFLQKAEDMLKDKWPWNRIGDYYIIALRKRDN